MADIGDRDSMSEIENTEETIQHETSADAKVDAVKAVAEFPTTPPPAPPVRTKKTALAAILEGDLDTVQMDDDSFRSMFDTMLSKVKEDEMVHGKVVSVTKDEILVDIGELLVECGSNFRIVGGARLLGEQGRELLPAALFGGEGAQVPARLGIARRGANVGDRGTHLYDGHVGRV